MFKFLFSILLFTAESWAQSGCTSTSAWTICDLTFDVAQAESSSELRAEFRSPRYKTVLIRAFRDGAKMILRFNPTGAGVWTYKLSSTLKKWDGMMGEVQATESAALGFVRATNTHHFATTLGGTDDRKPHLWMSAPVADFLTLPGNQLGPMLDARVNEKFTHIRFGIDAKTDLNEVAERMRIANAKGLVVDLVLAAIPGNDRDRESYVAEMVSRFAAFNMTWVLGPAFENVPQGRTLMKDAGNLLAKLDPYAHPRSALAQVSSGAFVGDGWMNVRSYGTVDANVGVVEHQFYQSPALNTGIASSKDLWNATMNGQYPAAGSGPHMKAWAEFMAQSRFWELEPYFDVDGGRALGLEDVEYLVYVEKPALVELTVEKHTYDVVWMNPATGEVFKQKEYNGEHFTGEPPNRTHDWVLRLSREGRKEGMLKSYKFDSRTDPVVQEIEQNPARVPFEIAAPAGEELSLSKPVPFTLKTKRETRATRSLLVNWTAEVVLDGAGYRIVGKGKEGTLTLPRDIALKYPAVMSLRAMVLNANGKAYMLDKVYRLVQ